MFDAAILLLPPTTLWLENASCRNDPIARVELAFITWRTVCNEKVGVLWRDNERGGLDVVGDDILAHCMLQFTSSAKRTTHFSKCAA